MAVVQSVELPPAAPKLAMPNSLTASPALAREIITTSASDAIDMRAVWISKFKVVRFAREVI
jgi:hypothetical protein